MLFLNVCFVVAFLSAGSASSAPLPVQGSSTDQLDFLPGIWRVHGWAKADPRTRKELDAYLVVGPWSDGRVSGFSKTMYSPDDVSSETGELTAEDFAGLEPIHEGYWLWDEEAKGWCSLAGWRPDYEERALVFSGDEGGALRSPVLPGSDGTGTFEQTVSFEEVSPVSWSLRIDRSYVDGTAVRLCTLDAEFVGEAGPPVRVLLEGGEDAVVTTLMEGFGGSRALAIDDEGTVYVAADRGFTGEVPILARTTDGSLRVVAEGLAPAGLVWRGGYLYVHAHDEEGGHVVRIDGEGRIEQLGRMDGDPLAVDGEGNTYTLIGRDLLRLRPGGEPEVWASSKLLEGCFGLTADERSDSMIVGNWSGGQVYRVREGQEPEQIGRIPGTQKGRCAWITMDGEDVLATSFGGSRVYRLDPQGEVSLVAGLGLVGGADGPGRDARFHNPNGIAVSGDGRLVYVAEIRPGPEGPFGHGRLRRIELGSPLLDDRPADGDRR